MSLTKQQRLEYATRRLNGATNTLANDAAQVTKETGEANDKKAEEVTRITRRTAERQADVDFWTVTVANITNE